MKTLICPNCQSELQFPEDASEGGFLWDPDEPAAAACETCDELVYEDDAIALDKLQVGRSEADHAS